MNIGDIVFLSPDSPFWGQPNNPANPKNIQGTVEAFLNERTLPIKVRWSNNNCNVYKESDLINISNMTPYHKRMI